MSIHQVKNDCPLACLDVEHKYCDNKICLLKDCDNDRVTLIELEIFWQQKKDNLDANIK